MRSIVVVLELFGNKEWRGGVLLKGRVTGNEPSMESTKARVKEEKMQERQSQLSSNISNHG